MLRHLRNQSNICASIGLDISWAGFHASISKKNPQKKPHTLCQQ